jgi:hypothetical protein
VSLKKLLLGLIPLLALTGPAYSLPIDWKGVFGVDTTLVDTYRRIDQVGANSTATGSQELPLGSGDHANASFQTYVFRLSPTIIVNDAVSFKGEVTNGYPRGGRFGEAPSQSLETGYANALYSMNLQDSNESQYSMLLNKFYLEIYSDTATYLVGRHSANWGLGAVINSGEGLWDRHSQVRDGVTMNIQIGSFKFSPYWSKIGSQGSLTRATKINDYGISLLYDNTENDMAFGLLYSIKKNGAFESSTKTRITSGTTSNLGITSVKLVDLYFTKQWGKFDFTIEAPLFSGEIGYLYNSTNQAKYKAKALIYESNYKLNNSWKLGLDFGHVSGDNGGESSFEAMYLNPNYQIANILFRYNMRAVSSPDTIDLYDSYISNTKYVKFSTQYTADRWDWTGAIVWAKANKVAIANDPSFNHTTNQKFTASFNQEDDYGFEIDTDFNYHWNSNLQIGGSLGYLFTGDYYNFTNTATPNTAKNSFMAQLRAGVKF